MSPTQRTLALLRAEGWTVAVVERWVPGRFGRPGFRLDCFGFLDAIAIRPDAPGVLGIQITSGPHHAEHAAKMRAEPRMQTWLLAGNGVELISWSKRGGRGERKGWAARRERLILDTYILADAALH